MALLPEFLDLEPCDLLTVSEQPDRFILERVCEWNNWQLTGAYPDMLVNKYVQVVLANGQAYYRILNARSHKHIEPLTMRQLQHDIKQELAVIDAWKTDHQTFLDQLYDRWLDLYNDPAGEDLILLDDLYMRMKTTRPGYRREFFGLDLNQLLAHEQPQIDNCSITVYPAEKTTKGFWVWDYHHGLHLIDRISFDEITKDQGHDESPDEDNPLLIQFNWEESDT